MLGRSSFIDRKRGWLEIRAEIRVLVWFSFAGFTMHYAAALGFRLYPHVDRRFLAFYASITAVSVVGVNLSATTEDLSRVVGASDTYEIKAPVDLQRCRLDPQTCRASQYSICNTLVLQLEKDAVMYGSDVFLLNRNHCNWIQEFCEIKPCDIVKKVLE